LLAHRDDVRNQLNAHVAAICVARNKLQVQMLMAQYMWPAAGGHGEK